MGNSNKTQDRSKFGEAFNQLYKKEKDINDNRFGNVTVYRELSNPANKLFMQLFQLLKSQKKEYNDLGIPICDKRSRIKNKSLIRLLGYQSAINNSLCSEHNQIECYCEFLENTLEEEIDNRFHKKEHFPESDIWLMMYQIIQAQLSLEAIGMTIGDLRPTNLGLTTNGDVKVVDSQFIPTNKTGYQNFIVKQEAVYLSPELMKNARHRNLEPQYDKFKSDIYSMGITILQACTLSHSGYYYDYKRNVLKYALIEEDLNFTKTIYPSFLCNVIKQCLEKNPIDRPTFKEINVKHDLFYCLCLQAALKPYYSFIEQGQAFTPSYEASKQSLTTTLPTTQKLEQQPTDKRQVSPKQKTSKMYSAKKTSQKQFTQPQQVQVQMPLQQQPEYNMKRSHPLTINPQAIPQYIQPQSLILPQQSYSPVIRQPNMFYQPTTYLPQPNQEFSPTFLRNRSYSGNLRMSQTPKPTKQFLQDIDDQSRDLDEKVQRALQYSQETLRKSTTFR